MRPRALALCAALLAGCSTTWESGEPVQATSYAENADAVLRYAGKLRRLVALAPVVEAAEEKCAPRLPAAAAQWVAEEARDYLTDWKGYSLLAAREDALVRALGPWQAHTPEQRHPPEALAAKLRALASAHGADGVLAMNATPECIDAADITLMFMIVGMPRFYGKVLGRDFSAGLYDADGTLVWQGYAGLGPLEYDEVGLRRSQVAGAVEMLFGLLENAIPEILLR